MSLFAVEPDICDLSTDTDALRKQIWLVMKNLREKDFSMANMNYGQFCQMIGDLQTKLDKIQRKIEDFESNVS